MTKSLIKHAIALGALLLSPQTLADTQWRTVSPEKLMVMTLPHGQVVFELAPQFAPNHVKHFAELASKGHYDNNTFYRVIDGFVAQVGPGQSEEASAKEKTLAIESEWTLDSSAITSIQSNDLFAEQTGFIDGFAVASDSKDNKAWLTHCPGVVAMARGNEPDSATSHFYITNGQAPRYLDRIMTVFGRVVYGMDNVQAIKRTSVIEGDKPVDAKDYTPILSMQLMSSLPKAEQFVIQIEDTNSKAFKDKIVDRRARPHAFFYKKPPPVLDVCQVPVRSKVIR
ncbi:peptidylprolyl isomerase [Thalassotalea euphylliae]|uniref:peptidylprolyl isomerase n=1 Tax=Thalassotalea euphylliae TaxID=1655234 RepID=UPI00363DDFC2